MIEPAILPTPGEDRPRRRAGRCSTTATAAPRVPRRACVDRRHLRGRAERRVPLEAPHGGAGSLGRAEPMPQAVRHRSGDSRRAVSADAQPSPQTSSPGLDTHTAPTSQRRAPRLEASGAAHVSDDRRAARARRVDVDEGREAPHRAEAGARRCRWSSGRRESTPRRSPCRRPCRAPGSRAPAVAGQRPHDQLTAARVLDEVRRQLGDDERQLLPAAASPSPTPRGQLHDAAARLSDLTAVADRADGAAPASRHIQRAMRHPRALARPRGDLELVGQPLGAAQAEAEAGAGRVAVRQGPRRRRRCPAPCRRTSAEARGARRRAAPPAARCLRPPWTRVLRASSLAAVTILVWSTRRNPSATASSRVDLPHADDVGIGLDRPASHSRRTVHRRPPGCAERLRGSAPSRARR